MPLLEPRVELPGEVAGILLAALKDDARTRVGGQRLARRAGQLAEMLVRQHQAEVVAAGLDQDLVKALGEVQVVLELVQA